MPPYTRVYKVCQTLPIHQIGYVMTRIQEPTGSSLRMFAVILWVCLFSGVLEWKAFPEDLRTLDQLGQQSQAALPSLAAHLLKGPKVKRKSGVELFHRGFHMLILRFVKQNETKQNTTTTTTTITKTAAAAAAAAAQKQTSPFWVKFEASFINY